MEKIKLLKSSCLSLLLFGLHPACNPGTKKATNQEKPNVLFIFADDQCFSTIHALGNNEIKTPNLDRLVNKGVTFTHAFNMGGWSGAICIASRAMLNTGRFVWRAHSYENHLQDLADRGEMWGSLMQKAGYETYMTGKWHLQIDPEKLFNHVVHVRPGMPPDALNREKLTEGLKTNNLNLIPIGYNRPLSPADTVWKPWDKKFGGYWEGGKHWSEVVGDDAIAFLDSAKNSEKPFFMYLAFNSPHDPRQSPKEFVDMYPLENISLPTAYMPDYPYRGDSIGLPIGQRDESLAPVPRTEYAVKVNRQEYYAIITFMDQQIGRILDALEKSGKAENTYIFFTADNGLALGNHGLMGKQNLHDHSIRVPLLVAGPDVPANKKIDADVYLQDIMASAIDIAGVDKPEYIDFNSLMPLVRGERSESFYPEIYGGYRVFHRMIRADGFKLIVYPRIHVMRLYDLTKDPFELNDITDDPGYAETKVNLYRRLIKLQKEMDDSLDLTAFFPEIQIQD